MQSPVVPERATRRSWLIWGTAVLVYLLAVFHRTSFGVAGLEAADRFGVGAAMLGSFAVLQIAVYAAMQIPTGVLVDRFGPRRILTAALLFLGLGQTLLALADSYALGLLARGVIGFGDALTFVSVLRLAANHFPPRRFTLVTTLTSALGFLGNLAATVPLTLLLADIGWVPVFLTAGVVTAVYLVAVRVVVRDTPAGGTAQRQATSPREVVAQVASAWRVPGTRLGFWTHFSTTCAPATLGLMWGMPFLVQSQHLTPEQASGMLMVLVIASMIAGPLLGALLARRSGLRMPMVIGFLLTSMLAWSVLLLSAGRLPALVLGAAFAVIAVGGPMSTVAFMLARDYNPLHRVGTATGVVNVGGFVATTVASLLVGVLLQVTGEFRIGLAAIVAVVLVGASRMIVWYRRTRATVLEAQARGEDVPVPLRRKRWDARVPVPA